MIANKLLKIFEENNIDSKGCLELDSLKFTELVIEIEKSFHFKFDDEDLVFENFNFVDKIIKLIDGVTTKKYKSYLNKNILVKVDRKLGEKHPKYQYIYPLNYGYIPNTLSEDHEEIDAYILGIFSPVEEFKGICKGVVHRYNDDENKLIVMPENKNYSIEQIEALLEFQERFFKHEIIME